MSDTLSNKQMDAAVDAAEADTQRVIGEQLRKSQDRADPAQTKNEVDIMDALAARVRAGEPIHVTGPLTEATVKMHVATVNRLRELTGLAVHVIHS